MLHIFRRHSKSVLRVVLVCMAIGLMASFGVDYYSKDKTRNAVIKIDDKEISLNEFTRRKTQIQDNMRNRFGDKFQNLAQFFNFNEQAVNSLIDENLMNNLYTSLGLTVGAIQVESKVAETIASTPGLSGPLTSEKYERFLRATRLNEAELERAIKDQVLQESLSNIFEDLPLVSDLELRKTFEYKNSQYAFDYASFEAENFKAQVNTQNKEALTKYFGENQEEYRKPRTVKYSYVTFSPSDYTQQVEITPEDVRAAYDNQIDSFKLPKRWKLRQIVVNKKDSPSAVEKLLKLDDKSEQDQQKVEEAKKEKTLAIKARLNNGEEFAKVATEVSEDIATKEKGGDLGWLEAKQLPAAIKNDILKLEQGEISEIINSKDAFYIVSAEEIEDDKYKSFDEVKAQIEQDLRAKDAPAYARADVDAFVDGWHDQGEDNIAAFTAFASTKSKSVQSSNVFYPKGQGPSVKEIAITDAVINAAENSVDTVEVDQKFYVVHVDQVKDSYVPELGEVEGEVAEAYKTAEAAKLAKAKAQNLLNDVKSSKKPLKELASALGVEVKESPAITREGKHESPFDNQELSKAAFSLTNASPLAQNVIGNEDTFYIVELKSITPPKAEDFATKKEELNKEEQAKAQERLMQALRANLKAHSKIWTDPAVMDKNF